MKLWQLWVSNNPVFRYHFVNQTKLLKLINSPQKIVAIVALLASLYLNMVSYIAEHGLAPLILLLECFSLWLLAPLMTHSLFAMEFEKATWDMLVLTRLTVSQIVMGKFLSRLALLIALAFFFIPLLLIAIGVDYKHIIGANCENIYALFFMSLCLLFKSQLTVVSWAILMVAVTLWFSYRLKRGMITAAAVFVGQLLVMFVLPILWSVFAQLTGIYSLYAADNWEFDPFYIESWDKKMMSLWMFDPLLAILFYNPAFSLTMLFAQPEDMDLPLWGICQGIVYLLLAGLVILILMRSISKATRKRL